MSVTNPVTVIDGTTTTGGGGGDTAPGAEPDEPPQALRKAALASKMALHRNLYLIIDYSFELRIVKSGQGEWHQEDRKN
jgi:hypothetical protein